MKTLITLLTLSLLFSCKKEQPEDIQKYRIEAYSSHVKIRYNKTTIEYQNGECDTTIGLKRGEFADITCTKKNLPSGMPETNHRLKITNGELVVFEEQTTINTISHIINR